MRHRTRSRSLLSILLCSALLYSTPPPLSSLPISLPSHPTDRPLNSALHPPARLKPCKRHRQQRPEPPQCTQQQHSPLSPHAANAVDRTTIQRATRARKRRQRRIEQIREESKGKAEETTGELSFRLVLLPLFIPFLSPRPFLSHWTRTDRALSFFFLLPSDRLHASLQR